MSVYKKNILFVSGTRADYGKIKPLINVVNSDSRFNVKIFVTGMHLLKKFGNTVEEIKKENKYSIYTYINQNNTNTMDEVLAKTILGLSDYIKEFDTDMIIFHGDRVEALASAIVGSMNNILSVHIEGGEVSGTIDDMVRHSVSKLSHYHLVCNEDAKKNLIQLGESKKSISIIGSPDIDIMHSPDLPSLDEVKVRYEIKFSSYAISLFHPVTTEVDKFEEYSNTYIDSLIESKKNYIVILPNNDLGHQYIFNALKRIEDNKKFQVFPSLRFEYFLTLLKNAKFIIGNSSAGF